VLEEHGCGVPQFCTNEKTYDDGGHHTGRSHNKPASIWGMVTIACIISALQLRQELAKVRQGLSQANDSKALMAGKADAFKVMGCLHLLTTSCCGFLALSGLSVCTWFRLQKAETDVRDKLVSTTEKAAR
jgi:hypothetical protein